MIKNLQQQGEKSYVGGDSAYTVSGRRLTLLRQWVRLGNRLEFGLISDAGDQSEELAVASLDLKQLPSHCAKTLQCN